MHMIYEQLNGIVVRDMRQSDAQIITDEEIAQGWDAPVEKYEIRLSHQAEGNRRQAHGRRRADRFRVFRHGIPWRGFASGVWERPANVCEARICPGRHRRLVQGRGVRALCALPQRRRFGAVLVEEAEIGRG